MYGKSICKYLKSVRRAVADANGKKTFRAYLWAVCGAEYDQQHS